MGKERAKELEVSPDLKTSLPESKGRKSWRAGILYLETKGWDFSPTFLGGHGVGRGPGSEWLWQHDSESLEMRRARDRETRVLAGLLHEYLGLQKTWGGQEYSPEMPRSSGSVGKWPGQQWQNSKIFSSKNSKNSHLVKVYVSLQFLPENLNTVHFP